MMNSPFKLFGSPRRTEVLLLLRQLGESYPSELARLLEANLASTCRILDDLEREGVVVSRPLGRTRRMELNPRYFAARELGALLHKLLEADPRFLALSARRRSHPRRPSKDR